MAKKRILILGAGISGLSAAWYLNKNPEIEVGLLEKKSQPGGWLKSIQEQGFFFEQGPRTFKTSRSPDLLALIDELNLRERLIFSDPAAQNRFVWFQNKLEQLPKNPLAALFSPLTRKILFSLLMEWRVPAKTEEESIHEFFTRRFNSHLADVLVSPLTVGIFGGDSRELSIRSCFPRLKQGEEKYGSLTKAFFNQEKKKKDSTSALFSLQGGVEELIGALANPLDIFCRNTVKKISFDKEEVVVETNQATFRADHVISTLPPSELATLFAPLDQDLKCLFQSIRSLSMTIVNLGFRKNVLKQKGFGYLIPLGEKETVMGVVFDSCIFPEQNKHPEETRLTAMVRGEEVEALQIVLEALKRHLGITASPDFVSVSFAKESMPQYELGHEEKMAQIFQILKTSFPQFSILGNFYQGPSVNDCIAKAKKITSGIITDVSVC